jgi:monoterpene epsilon-lactone hydrolase
LSDFMEIPWNLPPLGEGRAAPADLLERRKGMRALNGLQIIDLAAPVRESVLGGVACIEAAPPGATTTFLYLHGGGYRLGEAGTWAGVASRIAAAAGVRVVVPDYRLAPEHPFPAALHDACSVYAALYEPGGAAPFVGGDSAGGGLACSLILAVLSAGMPPPAGAILVSPWLDLVPEAPSFQRCAASDAAFSAEAARAAADQYLQGQAARQPLLSPLSADLTGFPPSWIAASAAEVLVDQSVALAQRLTIARRPNVLRIERDMPHAWPVIVPDAAETADAIAGIAAFMKGRAP